MPAGKTFFSRNSRSFESKAYLLRLPLGVSMTIWMTPWSFRSRGSKFKGLIKLFCRFDFFAISGFPCSFLGMFFGALSAFGQCRSSGRR